MWRFRRTRRRPQMRASPRKSEMDACKNLPAESSPSARVGSRPPLPIGPDDQYREMLGDYRTMPAPSRYLARLAAAQPTREDLLELLAELNTTVGYCKIPLCFELGAPSLWLNAKTMFWVDAQGRQALTDTALQALAVRACEEAVCTNHNTGARFMVQREADKWFARRRPLAHWAVCVLTSHDLTPSILLQCDDALTLSRLAQVCRLTPELQLGLDAAWRALVVSRWASGRSRSSLNCRGRGGINCSHRLLRKMFRSHHRRAKASVSLASAVHLHT